MRVQNIEPRIQVIDRRRPLLQIPPGTKQQVPLDVEFGDGDLVQ